MLKNSNGKSFESTTFSPCERAHEHNYYYDNYEQSEMFTEDKSLWIICLLPLCKLSTVHWIRDLCAKYEQTAKIKEAVQINYNIHPQDDWRKTQEKSDQWSTQISQVCSENAVNVTCRHKSYELGEFFLREENVTKNLRAMAVQAYKHRIIKH